MLESEMVNNMNKYLIKNGICYANEIRMGTGIPDISFNLGANKKIKYIDDYFLFSILDFVTNKNETTIKEIGKEFLFTLEKVKKYVSQLVNMNLVRVKNQIVRAIKNIFESRLGITIAIEAKIKDWKNGFVQAQRYLSFSDYSYLALQEEYISNVDLEQLQIKGIGLLSVAGENLKEILSPVQSQECEYCLKYMHTSTLIHKYDTYAIEQNRQRKNIFSSLKK